MTKFGVLGSTGFIGQHVIEYLQLSNVSVVGASRRTGLDARDHYAVVKWIRANGITHLINLAAECGGIGLNREQPADLWLASTLINAGVLEAARLSNLEKLTLVGTVCSYAADCPTPFHETDLMHHGFPEYTNSAYGLAKLASYFGARAYRHQYKLDVIYMIPVNLYGPHDHFDHKISHVIPALIRRFVEARDTKAERVVVWGTGMASREFLYATDAAEALVKATVRYNQPEPINLGSGSEVTIQQLTYMIAELVGYEGRIEWDASKPDGQMRRCLDVTRARDLLGWEAKTSLWEGLRSTIEWYTANHSKYIITK